MQLEGRVALVTGGGRGIGRAISATLAREGARIAVNYRRDEEAAAETVASIEKAGGRARAYQASVDDFEADRAMVASILGDFGHIDILVNNAGIASRGQSVADTDPAELERALRTHAFAPHFLAKLVLPSMRTRERGDVVMVSSVASANLGANGAPYNMGKAAMEALAITLAKEEVANRIHVNTVAPGLVETEMGKRLVRATQGVEDIRTLDATMPMGRVCQPQDIANAVLFFCSPAAGYVTGQKIYVEGGGSWQR